MSEFYLKLEQTRKKLLDLTKRNKLINFRRPAKTRNLRIIDESPEFIYDYLVSKEKLFKFKFIPEPELLQLENKKLEEKKEKLEKVKESATFEGEIQAANNKINKIAEELKSIKADAMLTAEEQAKKLGFDISLELPEVDLETTAIDDRYTDDYLQTLHYPSDLEKILKKIDLSARQVIEETGANMLYMILGVLEWKEADHSDNKIKSPLINIPVSLKRGSLNKKTNTYEYVLEYTGEAIDTNKSLAEKLKNDFNIELPELTEELSFNEYMSEVKRICANKREWKIKQEIALDFLQFSKILMYKDLDSGAWEKGSLEGNEVFNDLFLGREISGTSYAPSEYDIDNHDTANKIPLVMDADSSQHSAIVDVLEGENVVIEGPPGTGKSQTIANMIASLMAEGKSVLFVSEKLAALEVVHKRLSNIGLGDFCLELHSHKTQKLKVLESLKKRLEGSYRTPEQLDLIKSELESKKGELKAYLDTIHLSHGNTDKKIFEIFWLVEKYNYISQYLKFDIAQAEKYKIIEINDIEEELKTYQSYVKNYDFETFYWAGFQINNLDFINIDMFIEKFDKLNYQYQALSDSYLDLEDLLAKYNIKNDISHQSKETNLIEALLTSIKDLSESVEQALLDNLNDTESYYLFKKYLELVKRKNKIQASIENEIIDYKDLTDEDLAFILNLDNIKIHEIETNYIEVNKEFKDLTDKLNTQVSLNNPDLCSDKNIEFLKSINSFLYSYVSISKLEEIEEVNDKLGKILINIEKVMKDFSRQVGIKKTYEIYEIDTIKQALSLTEDISQNLYVNCSFEAGTMSYKNAIEKALKERENVKIYENLARDFFDTSKVREVSISELKDMSKIIEDKRNSIFSVFSGAFKRARDKYATLLTSGTLPDNNSQWSVQLEKAIKYMEEREKFETNETYKQMFKGLFTGEQTDWDLINKLNDWALSIRNTVKINDLIEVILSGDEQIYLTLNSYSNDFTVHLDSFDENIVIFEKVYEKGFRKKIYHYVEDIDIVDLKDRLEEINDKIDEYLPRAKESILDPDTNIIKLIDSILDYKLVKQDLDTGKAFVEEIIHSSFDNSIVNTTTFINNILDFLEKQELPFASIANMLIEEKNSIIDLNNVTKSIKEELLYDLKQTDEEVESINQHLELINKIKKSDITPSLKELFINDFKETEDIFIDIVSKQGIAFSINYQISEYGTLDPVKFYGNDINRYENLISKLDDIHSNIDNLSIWIDCNNLLKRIREYGLIQIIESTEKHKLPKEAIIDAYYYNFYNSLLKSAFRKYPLLNKFSRLAHEEVIKTFKKLDLELLEINKEYVAIKSCNRYMPASQGGGSVKTFTNKKLVEYEISKKKRHIPIRQLINRAGRAMQSLKPCFMMSPLSVAQYLPPDSLKFDVLLVDEASQLRPEEALGVIARAEQIVIVGDPKQLPPTSFFDAMKEETDNEDETIVDESESILDTCIDLYSPVRRLKWHYRSQHESLIDFSNKHFYDDDLIVFPSPSGVYSNELGVKHTYIPNAIYQKGSSQRFNKLEAKVVIEYIEHQMKNFPEKSLGVGTFNTTQRDLIQQMLDEKEKSNPNVATYIQSWKNTAEPFFIKNLESLQGDERDVIFISTTYGKDKDTGVVQQKFGPINQDNGWRRLNVLFTRSKQKMHIFTSMQSGDIKIGETSSKGVIALRSFLKFLETDRLVDLPEITGKGFDSPFEESVYQLLSDAGIKAVPQVGVSGYFIDLAVEAEEGHDFILAIECDGATYHSSRSARDRDRLKDEVLKRLGWTVYRIWSVDWYKNRQNEVKKLLKVIKEQQAKYSEEYKYRKEVTPVHQEVVAEKPTKEEIEVESVEQFIEEDNETNTHSEETLNQNEYTQTFLDDESIKQLLVEFRDNEIAKEFEIDFRCILSSVMIDQFIKHKPLDMDEFRNKIPLRLRTSLDREQLVYIEKIFEIIELADE